MIYTPETIANVLQMAVDESRRRKRDNYPEAYGFLCQTVETLIPEIRGLDPAAALEAEGQ